MLYNFPGIAGAASDLTTSQATMQATFDEMQATVAKLSASWSSAGSMSWQDAQTGLGRTQAEIDAALTDMATKLELCGTTMHGTDMCVANRFHR